MIHACIMDTPSITETRSCIQYDLKLVKQVQPVMSMKPVPPPMMTLACIRVAAEIQLTQQQNESLRRRKTHNNMLPRMRTRYTNNQGWVWIITPSGCERRDHGGKYCSRKPAQNKAMYKCLTMVAWAVE